MAITDLSRKKQEVFLKELRLTGNVSAAAKAGGSSRRMFYVWRERSEDFAVEWDDALQEGCDTLEREARRRAAEGVDKPVFYRGEVVGHVREYSDLLLIFLLKAYRPAVFRESVDVAHTFDVTERFASAVNQAPKELRDALKGITETQRKKLIDGSSTTKH